jgi:hypothetical protein
VKHFENCTDPDNYSIKLLFFRLPLFDDRYVKKIDFPSYSKENSIFYTPLSIKKCEEKINECVVNGPNKLEILRKIKKMSCGPVPSIDFCILFIC